MNVLTQRGTLRRFAIGLALCTAACSIRPAGVTVLPAEHTATVAQAAVTSTVLHTFAGGATDGQTPYGSLVASGTTLYGMTSDGGGSSAGTVFKVDTDGSGFALVHTFAGGASDGKAPEGSLIVSGTTLYGLTRGGGASGFGTLFSVKTDGTSFALLRSFADGDTDGREPTAALLASGTTLYGTTSGGGTYGAGIVFKIEMNGTGFAVLHSFTLGGTGDGFTPYGSLIASGATLYGTTFSGGTNNLGTVFKIDMDGTGYTRLHSFAGGATDGKHARGELVVSGTTLFGMTEQGGTSDRGVVFKIATDGSGFALLRSFVGGATGATPYGSLLASGSTLYGMTSGGGGPAIELGTVFKMNMDGTGFAPLYSFGLSAADGSFPFGSLIASGPTLYGMNASPAPGGAAFGGTVFKVDVACAVNEHVAAGACVACAAGSTNAAGDDPAAGNTSCDVVTCLADQHVAANACVACAPGTERPAGDLSTSADTSCTATACTVNQSVVANVCTPCPAGTTRAAGDLATGADTTCAASPGGDGGLPSSDAGGDADAGGSADGGGGADAGGDLADAPPPDNATASSDSSGCTCATASLGSRDPSGAAVGALVALTLAALRRRRRTAVFSDSRLEE